MPDLAKQIKEYQPQPNPMAEQKAQLEMQLLQAQIQNESAKAAENAVDVEYKKAKTQTEISKSRNLNSKSDMEDLNFVEQESGVGRQHEENMKKVDQQNAMDNKFADAIINDPMLNGQ
jgi:phage shock protein A